MDDSRLEKATSMLKTISDTNRLKILYLIREKPMNVAQIGQATGMEQSSLSHQLKLLRDARLVKSTVDGRNRVYEPVDYHIYQILDMVFEHILEEEDEREED